MIQPHDAYLQTQILTASPQRLRLMLIEQALRDLESIARHWDDQRHEQGLDVLIHCRDIISELIAGVRPEESPLAQKVVSLYVFLFQSLTEAQLSRDRQKLALLRRVLSSERDTWQRVCQELEAAPSALAAGADLAPSSAPLALEA